MNNQNNDNNSFRNNLLMLWAAEKMLTDKLPVIVEICNNFGLRQNIATHLAETRQHAIIMQFILKQLDIPTSDIENPELQSILDEGDRMMKQPGAGDKEIITASKKVEAFEIQAYRLTAEQAEKLGHKFIASKLYCILEQEQQAETKLSFYENHMDLQNS